MLHTTMTVTNGNSEKNKGNRGVKTFFQGQSRCFTDIGTPKHAYLTTRHIENLVCSKSLSFKFLNHSQIYILVFLFML